MISLYRLLIKRSRNRNPILSFINLHGELRRCRPGAARQLLTFLASPRKVSKRRRRRRHCPSGSQLCNTKNGKVLKLATLCRGIVRLQANIVTQARCKHLEIPATPQTQDFLFPFSVSHNWQCHMRKNQGIRR